MSLRGRLGALEEREFRLLWFSRVVSDFGDRFGMIGLAFAVLAIERSATALAYVLAARTFRPDRQLVAAFLSLLIWTPVLIAYAVVAPVSVIAAFALVASAAVNFAGTIWFTAIQQHIPQHALSRVSSYDWAGSVLFLPLGYILVGPLADQFSASDVLYGAAVWTIISSLAILAIPSVRNLRRRDTPHESPEADPLTATQAAG